MKCAHAPAHRRQGGARLKTGSMTVDSADTMATCTSQRCLCMLMWRKIRALEVCVRSKLKTSMVFLPAACHSRTRKWPGASLCLVLSPVIRWRSLFTFDQSHFSTRICRYGLAEPQALAFFFSAASSIRRDEGHTAPSKGPSKTTGKSRCTNLICQELPRSYSH